MQGGGGSLESWNLAEVELVPASEANMLLTAPPHTVQRYGPGAEIE